jgi:hypothetical protein
MHEEVLPDSQRRALAVLTQTGLLDRFYLAGGTAVALHLGHRMSVDYDLFTAGDTAAVEIIEALGRHPGVRIDRQSAAITQGMIGEVAYAFVRYPYPLLEPLQAGPGQLRVAGTLDLACMKVLAVSQRGTRKDFVDFHFLLRQCHSLDEVLAAVPRKYPDLDMDAVHLLRGLTYFTDAEPQPMPRMLVPFDWTACKRDLTTQAAALARRALL